jgi:hypothetical protein
MAPNKDEVTTFSLIIETIASEKQIPYMEAVLLHCQNTGLEVELAAKLISGSLKAKIKMEAEALHFLPKSNTMKLPV